MLRLGRLIEADEAFEAWMSGNLDRMVRALRVHTNPIDRHHLLQSIVKEAYRRRKDPDMRRLARTIGYRHLDEFAEISRGLATDYGGAIPNVPSFKWLATILVESGEYDEAIAVCDRAVQLGLRDGTKGGYAKRLERLRDAAAKRSRK